MAATPPARIVSGDTPQGFAYALAAYVLWGFLPLYMKALDRVPVLEVLAHRAIWSVPVALLVLIALGRTSDLRAALRSPRLLGMGAITAALISINWGIYVHAIVSGQAMEAALGYYINPLFSILLGRMMLGEKLLPLQWASVALAAAGVGWLTWSLGRLPFLALAMMLSWGFYAYFKKSLPLGANQGFTLEVILLLPFALAYAVWSQIQGGAEFLHDARHTALLLGCGVVTALPLMAYGNGAKMLRLTTIGVMQYITPTLIFLTAVFLFGEPFASAQAVAFAMIWGALVLYTVAMLRGR